MCLGDHLKRGGLGSVRISPVILEKSIVVQLIIPYKPTTLYTLTFHYHSHWYIGIGMHFVAVLDWQFEPACASGGRNLEWL
jgi:hypothetical protein